MSPNELSWEIEARQPRMKNPRVRLLLESYAEAMREPNKDFQYLRLWTLLELMAKDAVKSRSDEIVDHEGKPLLDRQGRKITTSTALPRVYKYLYDRDYGAAPQAPSVWLLLSAAYKVRNAVAHEGAFRPQPGEPEGSPLALASEQYAQPFDQVFDFLKDVTWLSVLREAQRA